jgi:flagellar biosynthesis protein FliR
VSILGSEAVLAAFLVFCRIGACLMILPGVGSARIPVRVRLFMAVAATLALTPLLSKAVEPLVADGAPAALLRSIGSELVIGFLIGLLGRLFFEALRTIAVAVTQAIGLAGMPGSGIEDEEPLPPIAALLSMTAVTLMFVTDQHWMILRGLVDSYQTIPADGGFNMQTSLIDMVDQLTAVFVVALRLGSPFIAYSIVVNFAVGLANKLTPQIPVYFIALPFVLAGGLLLLAVTAHEFIANFIAAFGAWLSQG